MGVQFQSYGWMCVGGKYIVLVFEGLLERMAEKRRRSKGHGECIYVSRMIVFVFCFFGRGGGSPQEII